MDAVLVFTARKRYCMRDVAADGRHAIGSCAAGNCTPTHTTNCGHASTQVGIRDLSCSHSTGSALQSAALTFFPLLPFKQALPQWSAASATFMCCSPQHRQSICDWQPQILASDVDPRRGAPIYDIMQSMAAAQKDQTRLFAACAYYCMLPVHIIQASQSPLLALGLPGCSAPSHKHSGANPKNADSLDALKLATA